jgi:hypothetical protein
MRAAATATQNSGFMVRLYLPLARILRFDHGPTHEDHSAS